MNDETADPPSPEQSDRRDQYAIYARSLTAAYLVASERDLWLHSWSWVTDQDAPDEPTVIDRDVTGPLGSSDRVDVVARSAASGADAAAATGGAAIRAFVRITRAWGLTSAQARSLIGGMHAESWEDWTTAGIARPTSDQLTRIGHLLGIYADLHALHASELADAWVSRPNTHLMFAGRTPIAVMDLGGVPAMAEVRGLLDARRHQP